MIGPGWSGDEPTIRPESGGVESKRLRRVAIVTGSRAEYGLLRPVMRAVQQEPSLELFVVAAGSHMIPPALTFRDVKADFEVADSVPMQVAGRRGRLDDVEAVGKGIARFARSFGLLEPDWVVVLGDRIEAFAAASAASIGGIGLAHIHGGDRAEGVADEAMRHAITKLAHLHLAATETSAERIRKMGERAEHVHVVGSPAIDELESMPLLDDESFAALGSPEVVFLMHPLGRHPEEEELHASEALAAIGSRRCLVLHPNHDTGRQGIVRAIEAWASAHEHHSTVREHLPREQFVGALRRVADSGGVLVGNSSAGLIEAAALGLAAVDIGARQSGRERPQNVVASAGEATDQVAQAIETARELDLAGLVHPYGDGHAGERVARLLASTVPSVGLLRKHCVY